MLDEEQFECLAKEAEQMLQPFVTADGDVKLTCRLTRLIEGGTEVTHRRPVSRARLGAGPFA